ncbi:Transmembrane domain-containing protein [Orpheovirus IHUMI-LCC2]|uniref:Transmembrane domain-containing protein n=1 Tax=Orpheovirus IHUMI-LCC2 TaxID=2023057 RepID=A0A2I2L4B6_9VIRU|nr:Transmembrane domain-containing protein [Orpheovirus IHUMI-LCC2]SNW62367.1 Transmembrane domain-containing protein [Orpheovirus IHUMI-LCC2]
MEPLMVVMASALIGKGMYNRRAEKLHRQKIFTFKTSKSDEISVNNKEDYVIEYKCGTQKTKIIKYYDYRHDAAKSEYRWNNVVDIIKSPLLNKWDIPKMFVFTDKNMDVKILPYTDAINYSMKKYYHDISVCEFTSSNIMIKEKDQDNLYAYGRNIDGKFKASMVSDNQEYLLDRIVDKCYIPYIISGCGLLSISGLLHYF